MPHAPIPEGSTVHERYADRYGRDQSVAMAVARDVCGHELAESGYTTRVQAERLVTGYTIAVASPSSYPEMRDGAGFDVVTREATESGELVRYGCEALRGRVAEESCHCLA